MSRTGGSGRLGSRSHFADGLSSFADIFPVTNLDRARAIASRDDAATDEANLLDDWTAVGRDIRYASDRFRARHLPSRKV